MELFYEKTALMSKNKLTREDNWGKEGDQSMCKCVRSARRKW